MNAIGVLAGVAAAGYCFARLFAFGKWGTLASTLTFVGLYKLYIFLRRPYLIFFPAGRSSYTEQSIRRDQGTLYDVKGANQRRIMYAFVPYRTPEDNTKVSPRVIIFFHGNAEDVGEMMPMIRKLRDIHQANVIGVEYPGYGTTYTTQSPDADLIKQDAEMVYEFVTGKLGFDHKNVLVLGRSIGSGAASHLAGANPRVRNLALLAPIASIRSVARTKIGWLTDILPLENFFDNEESIRKTNSRLMIVHGKEDNVVPPSQGRALAHAYDGREGRRARFELIEAMGHNDMDAFMNSRIQPLIENFTNGVWDQANAANGKVQEDLRQKMSAQ